MVKYIHKQLILNNFPFVSRKQEKNDSIEQEARDLQTFLQCLQTTGNPMQPNLLFNLQQLTTLEASIDVEINAVYAENIQLNIVAS